MRKMKKIAALLMALIMVLALATSAMAASGTNDNSGKITITGTVANQTYTPYQILVLESYDTTSGAFSYTAHTAWADWLATQTTYVSVNADGYVTWVTGASAADFAKAAMAHIDAVNSDSNDSNNIVPAQPGKTAAADNEHVVFEGLNLGYYLIDSTLGALCALNTTSPEVEIAEKNFETTINKKVNAGETHIDKPAGYDYVESVTKQIGTIVDFTAVITIWPGATNYVYHDSMEAGLTYVNSAEYPTEIWTYPMSSASAAKIDAAYYTVNDAPTCSHDGKDCDFIITLSQDYLDSVTQMTQITVRYFAELNENAVTYHEDADGNINFAKLTYGDNSQTEWDPAVVYTYSFELVKTDANNKVITGAEFELYDAATGGNKIPLVAVGNVKYHELDGDGNPVYVDTNSNGVFDEGVDTWTMIDLPTYRPATSVEIAAPGFASAKIEVGRAVIKGLPLGVTYYLEEAAAPDGFNKLDERVSVVLAQSTSTGHVLVNGSSDHMAVVLADVYHNGGVAVKNYAGSILPETGGIGTTIFYAVGGVLVLGAVVLLITKRRMSSEG